MENKIGDKMINNTDDESFNEKIVKNLGVYGIAACVYCEKYGKLDDAGCDKFASWWEQSFEESSTQFLQSLTEEDVEMIIRNDEKEL